MFEIRICGEFTATHRLRYPDGVIEPCHEHRWQVTAAYAGPALDPLDLLVDFGVVRADLAGVLHTLDRQNLNELAVFAGRNPSAEVVAQRIAERLRRDWPNAVRLQWVSVEEERGCVARYHVPTERECSAPASESL
jgi:6-pyruvoyl-tetrahydropterin synthase